MWRTLPRVHGRAHVNLTTLRMRFRAPPVEGLCWSTCVDASRTPARFTLRSAAREQVRRPSPRAWARSTARRTMPRCTCVTGRGSVLAGTRAVRNRRCWRRRSGRRRICAISKTRSAARPRPACPQAAGTPPPPPCVGIDSAPAQLNCGHSYSSYAPTPLRNHNPKRTMCPTGACPRAHVCANTTRLCLPPLANLACCAHTHAYVCYHGDTPVLTLRCIPHALLSPALCPPSRTHTRVRARVVFLAPSAETGCGSAQHAAGAAPPLHGRGGVALVLGAQGRGKPPVLLLPSTLRGCTPP